MASSHTTLESLVARFKAEESRFTSNYSETEARVEFIDPLFDLLGWDTNNSAGVSNGMKDVVREETLATESPAKRPDYTFRIASIKKFFTEAKRPSVDITKHKESAFQVRSYGYTAGLPVSILTNFRTFRVYDTRLEPRAGDDADVGLLMSIDYENLPGQLPELIARFGRDEVAAGSLEKFFKTIPTGTIPVNIKFLERINRWRVRLAQDLYDRHSLSLDALTDIAQKVVNRIIFIRMCEDRGIEGEERLRKVARKLDFIQLRELFKQLDNRYNTGLFDINADLLQSSYEIDANLFLEIVDEVYAPNSPYSFSVLDAGFLGQVYELFLMKRLAFDGGSIVLADKPAYEGREIVTTPQPLVDEVVRRALAGKLTPPGCSGLDKLEELEALRILDVAVGSSRFLLRAFDGLVDAAIVLLRKLPPGPHLYRITSTNYKLSFEVKRDLLQKCLFGIDIDYNAVEVARFSLMVKLLEDETAATLPPGRKILPDLDRNILCGNSVVAADFPLTTGAVFEATNPFEWSTSGLPSEFDVIVGNPPYVKTEDMKAKTPDEMAYYKNTYTTPYRQFDKSFVFIEQALRKLKADGWLGMIVPNKWITIGAAEKLRELLAKHFYVAEIVDFGNEKLFEGKSAYVCLLVLAKKEQGHFFYRHIDKYSDYLAAPAEKGHLLPASVLRDFGRRAWILPGTATEEVILSKLKHSSVLLGDIADVKNGIQTSANDVFLINSYGPGGNAGLVKFERDGRTWEIEEGITRPYINNSTQVISYQPITADALMIFPYQLGVSGTPVPISPAELACNYPLAWAYLQHFKTRLENRNVHPAPQPGVFYAYGRHQALETVFLSPKIVYSVNQKGDKYGIDLTGVAYASGGTAGEVAIVNPRKGYSLEFILALLNQKAMEFFLRKHGSPFGNGYFGRGSAVMNDVPVPALDLAHNPAHIAAHAAIVADVTELIQVRQELFCASGRKRPQLETRRLALHASLDSGFDALWGFTDEVDQLTLPGGS